MLHDTRRLHSSLFEGQVFNPPQAHNQRLVIEPTRQTTFWKMLIGPVARSIENKCS
jgi:hypothetical protein